VSLPDLPDFGDKHLYFDKAGNPITMMEWSRLLGDMAYKVICKDVFIMGDEPVEVSTVWLGLNHQWMPGGPLRIFETMIFGGDLHLEQWRYATEEEAREGHAETVKLVRVICDAQAQ